MTQPTPTPREYDAHARTTDVFGRVLDSVRQHHFIVDGPVQNNCPGEAVTPGELFLAAVASCGVELLQVIAREDGLALTKASVAIHGVVDRSRQPREDLTLFNSVDLRFRLTGVSHADAGTLVEKFTRRCPLYGTVAAATPKVSINFTSEP